MIILDILNPDNDELVETQEKEIKITEDDKRKINYPREQLQIISIDGTVIPES